jgi:hypothetical protein
MRQKPVRTNRKHLGDRDTVHDSVRLGIAASGESQRARRASMVYFFSVAMVGKLLGRKEQISKECQTGERGGEETGAGESA